jgi:23S rRNA pseudouridine1911/1915/1917 synthase
VSGERLEGTVPPALEGLRLDQVLAALFPGLSRRRAREFIERGSVYLDGRRCRVASRPLRSGAALKVVAGEQAAPSFAEVAVLWKGEGLVAVDKPPGVALTPTRSAAAGTVLHALARQVRRPLRQLHPAHRLDTPTSGVALVALEAAASAFLGRAFQEGAVRKTYLAWVAGAPEPPEGEWSWPLAEESPGVVRVSAGGKRALTRYRTIRQEGPRSLLELEPATGRTHQLRVHAAQAGHPILGDRKYGGPPAPRLLLHAWRITFPLPSGGEKTVESPLPKDFKGEIR